MDAVFEFFFKYRPVVYERGTLALAAPAPVWVLLVGALVLIGLALWTYLRSGVGLSRRDRAILAALRAAAVALVVFCLARPVLVVAEAIPQRNVVGVVIDDSRSMRVGDVDGSTRGSRALSLAGGPESTLVQALGDRFHVRFFRTSGAGGRANDVAGLSFDATRTRLLPSLMRVGDELAGAPVAGLVMLSDGADNSMTIASEPGEGLSEQLLALRARGVPVYAVGIGQERLSPDIEVARVDAPRVVLRDGALVVDAVVMQQGYGGTKVTVVAEDGGRIVGTKEVTLPRDGEAVVARIRVPTSEAGARTLAVKVPVQRGELLAENNERRTMVVVRDRREKVLYLEGEPRFELKFMRRAVEGDNNLQLVTLLRSAKDKFLRLSVDDSVELASGFPKTREELFGYRAVVLGSVEASFFTVDQLRMLADFVSVRGGGLLALGGRRAFAEGGYAGTPLADVLPVELALPADSLYTDEVGVRVSLAGALHPAMQLAGNDSLTVARWARMPRLTMVNRIGRAKPGATVLLEGAVEGERGGRPVFAFQRFGRGKVAAFAVQDSWLWQMHSDVSVDDASHETFWRQVLRWLVSETPDRVDVTVPDDAGIGEGVLLRAAISDPAYLRANGASVRGTVTTASGEVFEVPFEWSAERDGEYRATFVTDAPGVHEVKVRAALGRDTLVSEPAFVRAAEPTAEYFGAAMRPALLRQIAEETGGKYYDLADASNIARDIVYSRSGATVTQRLDLWDMPLVLMLLLGALGAEWLWRRRRGLA